MKQKSLRNLLIEDQQAMAIANALVLIDKLKQNQVFVSLLNSIDLPSDKYLAIQKFASILGIPESRFIDYCQRQDMLKNSKNK